MIAAAALVRIAVVAAGFDHTSVSALLWLPVTTWLVGGLLLASATRRLAAGPEPG
ncbi:hypothetical protein [Mycobacterium sp. SA01]|uniref:hypothetical protein n=1 Tax=Mycobacterium sp. SA01 TaxID=3238820 RepID=UPI00351B1E52